MMPIYKKVFNPYAKYKKKPPSSLSQPTIMPSDIGRYHPPQFFHSQGVSAGSLENNVLGHVGGGTISYGSSPQPFEISMSELVRRDLAEKHAAKPKKLDATPKTLAAMRPTTPEKLAATTPKKLAAKTPKKLAAMKPPAKKPTVAAKKPTVTAKKPTAASAAKKPTKHKSTTSTTKRKSSVNPNICVSFHLNASSVYSCNHRLLTQSLSLSSAILSSTILMLSRDAFCIDRETRDAEILCSSDP
jgi:hypothetical protein